MRGEWARLALVKRASAISCYSLRLSVRPCAVAIRFARRSTMVIACTGLPIPRVSLRLQPMCTWFKSVVDRTRAAGPLRACTNLQCREPSTNPHETKKTNCSREMMTIDVSV